MPYNITTTCPPLTGIFGSAVTDYLISVTIPITGGNIIIPVGSTRFYKNLHSAYQSVSGLLFNETANVVFKLDPEEINEPFNLDLTHRSSNVFTVSGTSLEWESTKHPSLLGSPIVSVAGLSTVKLSATISFDANYSIPAVGDYINITSLSGRHVGSFHADFLSGNRISLNYGTEIPNKRTTDSSSPVSIKAGDPVLLTYLGSSTSSEVIFVSGFSVDVVSPPIQASTIRLTRSIQPSTQLERGFVVQIGTPSSFRNGTFTQTANSTTITFLTGSNQPDAPTNTWLNEGDCIFALGQVRIVQSVATNNTCTINLPFRTGITAGFQELVSTPVPYLIKTHFERYRGVHKVVAVNSNNVTVEIIDYGYKTTDPIKTPTPPTPGDRTNSYFEIGHRQVPLPRFGIHSAGAPQGADIIPTENLQYNRDKIFKTKLNFTNTTFVNNNACIYLLGNLKSLTDVCLVVEKPFPYVGLAVGSSGVRKAPASINIGTPNGGAVGIYGFLASAYLAFEDTTTNSYNFSVTNVYNNYDNEIGVQFIPFPNFTKLTDLANTETGVTYPLKNSFNIRNVYGLNKLMQIYSLAGAIGTFNNTVIRDIITGYLGDIKPIKLTLVGGYSNYCYFGTQFPALNTAEYIYISYNSSGYQGPTILGRIFKAESYVLRDGNGGGDISDFYYGDVYNSTIVMRSGFIGQIYDADIVYSFMELANVHVVGVRSDVQFFLTNVTGGRTRAAHSPALVPGYSPSFSGGGFYFGTADNTWTSGIDSGNVPPGQFYFIPTPIYALASVNKTQFESTTNFYNCGYAGGVLNSSATSITLDTDRASKFNNLQNSAVLDDSSATVISQGFNTATNNFILY
jgi:hypothetical protein